MKNLIIQRLGDMTEKYEGDILLDELMLMGHPKQHKIMLKSIWKEIIDEMSFAKWNNDWKPVDIINYELRHSYLKFIHNLHSIHQHLDSEAWQWIPKSLRPISNLNLRRKSNNQHLWIHMTQYVISSSIANTWYYPSIQLPLVRRTVSLRGRCN